MDKSKDFKTLELGSSYELPMYEVIPGVGLTKTDNTLVVNYVRGAKDSENIKKEIILNNLSSSCGGLL